MIDHISMRVTDIERAAEFYAAALAPLGYEVVMRFPGYVGLGAGGKPDFWLTATDKAINPTHIAFACDRSTVTAFHAAAVAAGGTDNGAPGPRADYHPNYFGAFILDFDGNNVEAVCHAPAKAAAKSASKAKPKAKPKAKAKRAAPPRAKAKAKKRR